MLGIDKNIRRARRRSEAEMSMSEFEVGRIDGEGFKIFDAMLWSRQRIIFDNEKSEEMENPGSLAKVPRPAVDANQVEMPPESVHGPSNILVDVDRLTRSGLSSMLPPTWPDEGQGERHTRHLRLPMCPQHSLSTWRLLAPFLGTLLGTLG